jgi:hypothetical protein
MRQLPDVVHQAIQHPLRVDLGLCAQGKAVELLGMAGWWHQHMQVARQINALAGLKIYSPGKVSAPALQSTRLLDQVRVCFALRRS